MNADSSCKFCGLSKNIKEHMVCNYCKVKEINPNPLDCPYCNLGAFQCDECLDRPIPIIESDGDIELRLFIEAWVAQQQVSISPSVITHSTYLPNTTPDLLKSKIETQKNFLFIIMDSKETTFALVSTECCTRQISPKFLSYKVVNNFQTLEEYFSTIIHQVLASGDFNDVATIGLLVSGTFDVIGKFNTFSKISLFKSKHIKCYLNVPCGGLTGLHWALKKGQDTMKSHMLKH